MRTKFEKPSGVIMSSEELARYADLSNYAGMVLDIDRDAAEHRLTLEDAGTILGEVDSGRQQSLEARGMSDALYGRIIDLHAARNIGPDSISLAS